MTNKIITIFVWAVIGIAVIWGGSLLFKKDDIEPPKISTALDSFAVCLSDKGIRMYGADWCPHCQNQKKLFGTSFSFVNYTECALPNNPRQQAKVCSDADITGYPTWVFASGERIEGEATFEQLAKKSGCEYK